MEMIVGFVGIEKLLNQINESLSTVWGVTTLCLLRKSQRFDFYNETEKRKGRTQKRKFYC